MGTVKQAWDKTAGYKTPAGVALFLLFNLFKLIWPQAMNTEWQNWTNDCIVLVISTGLLDKALRNREKIMDIIKKLLTKKVNKDDRT